MLKITYIALLILFFVSSCKQESEKKVNYKSDIEDLDKKYGHLFDGKEDSIPINNHMPKAFSTSKYEIRFLDIDRELFYHYKSNANNTPLITDLPKNIKQKDSCFYIKHGSFKDTLCDNLNDDFSDEYIDYHFLGHWDSLKYAIFESGIYEELIYFIYNIENGNKTFLWNIPVLSPDKKFVLTSSFDLVAGFQPNGIQMFEIIEKKIEKEFEIEFELWGPDSCYWINENEVVFKRIILDFDDYSVKNEEYTLMKISKLKV